MKKVLNIKKLLTIFFVLSYILMATYYIAPVSAHVLKTDGTIGAVLHLDPEDDPIANYPANFYLDFKDTVSKFNFKDCKCVINITKNGQNVYSQDLISPYFTYTFPEKNVYILEVIGRPLDGNSFNEFKLDYQIRVAREISNNSQKVSSNWFVSHIFLTVGLGFIVSFLIFYLVIQSKRPKPNVPKD
jgi:hypothetical protein